MANRNSARMGLLLEDPGWPFGTTHVLGRPRRPQPVGVAWTRSGSTQFSQVSTGRRVVDRGLHQEQGSHKQDHPISGGSEDSTRKHTKFFHIVEVQILEVHASDRLDHPPTQICGLVRTAGSAMIWATHCKSHGKSPPLGDWLTNCLYSKARWQQRGRTACNAGRHCIM